MCDEYIPFWNMVYHGIVLYNCFAATVNANIQQDPMLKVMNYAWGGRPLNYVNTRFLANSPWGDKDLRFTPLEEFQKDVALIKKDYDFYQTIRHLQFEFIEDYEVLSNGVIKTLYSNGEFMLSNAKDQELSAEGRLIPPCSNLLCRK